MQNILTECHATKIFWQSVMPQKYFGRVSCHKNILAECHATKIIWQSVMPQKYFGRVSCHKNILPSGMQPHYDL
jgi:hypothetical protein